MTHTPGPWENTPDSGEIADASGFYVARAISAVTPEGKANARLIAAAPDLLAALEAIMGERWSPQGRSEAVSDQARAAIAKAKGEA